MRKEAQRLVVHWLALECGGDPAQLLALMDPALHTGTGGGGMHALVHNILYDASLRYYLQVIKMRLIIPPQRLLS